MRAPTENPHEIPGGIPRGEGGREGGRTLVPPTYRIRRRRFRCLGVPSSRVESFAVNVKAVAYIPRRRGAVASAGPGV
jgi:hypothetical protein